MMSSPARAGILAFVTALVALFTQVLVHRMVSAKLINNFAFLVISLTMLGFAFSGVVLSRWRERCLDNLDDVLLGCAALFALTLIGAAGLFYHAPPAGGWGVSRAGFVATFLYCVPLSLLFAIPFAFCGLILGALLAAPGLSTPRIYFFDLIGSAAGAFVVLPAVGAWGVERGALLACATLVAAALLLTSPRLALARPLAGLAGLAILLAAVYGEGFFAMKYPAGSILGTARDPSSGFVLEDVKWDPVARIELTRIPPPSPEGVSWPSLIGSNREFHRRFRKVFTQNNNAFTYAVDYDGRPETLSGIEETIYATGYQAGLVDAPRVVVIGVGGGFDVLTALHFGASEILGAEVNGATLGMLTRSHRAYFRAWIDDPRVRLFHDEGRHFLAVAKGNFDVIQLSGVDSASGTPAAAHVFSENYVYSAEAFDLYLSRLTDQGIVHMMRTEWIPPREMLRALTTAVAALRRAGRSHPAEHVILVSSSDGLFASLLVKKTPFHASERSRVAEWAGRNKYLRLAASSDVNQRRENVYQAFLLQADPRREDAFVRLYPFDIRPASDDRPFFFKYSYWSHLWSGVPVIRASVPAMELGLLLLLGTTGLASLIAIGWPLSHLNRAGKTAAESRRYGWYFAATGLGYMAIEIALLQKFGLFLGHPNYSLSVVLATLLLATGLGSLYSVSLVKALGGVRFVAYALAGVLLFENLVVLPRLLTWIDLPWSARVALVGLLVLPPGICLGVFLPSGLERLKGGAPSLIPWAWGVNGMFSVIGPILSVAFSTTWGIDALLLSSIPVYLVAAFSLPMKVHA